MSNEERALAYARDIARLIRYETVQRPVARRRSPRCTKRCARCFHASSRVRTRGGGRQPDVPLAGESSDDALLLMSHHDVVAAHAEEWCCDPFAGEIRCREAVGPRHTRREGQPVLHLPRGGGADRRGIHACS